MENISSRINLILKEKGITKSALAREICISPQAVNSLCNGTNNPSPQTIQLICNRYNIRKEWLETGEGEMQDDPPMDEIAAYARQLMKDTDNPLFELIVATMRTYDGLSEKNKEAVKSFAKDLKENLQDTESRG
jgi:transcriptional regulator with XRE-family HTH domain